MNMLRGMASLGERGRRGDANRSGWSPRLATALSHLAGSAVGGALFAVALWFLAAPLRTLPAEALVVGVVMICALCAAVDLRLIEMPKILKRGQVPIEWSTSYGFVPAFFLYGVSLGAALFTFVPYAITFAVFAVAALSTSLATAVLAGFAFGIGRALFVSSLAQSLTVVRRSGGLLAFGARWFPSASSALAASLAAAAIASAIGVT